MTIPAQRGTELGLQATSLAAAGVGDDLWVVNARFGTAADSSTEYWLTRLAAVGDEDA